MFLELFWSILSQARWTLFDLVRLVKSSDQTISFLANLELVTTGLKVITQKVPNWSIQFSMLSERKPNHATVFKDFN